MNLTLTRTMFRDDGVYGEIVDEKGKWLCITLEHSYDLKPKLPDGNYKCIRGEHALKDGVEFQTFEVTGVEGHTGILFHVGNYNDDSEGCILLGERLGWQLSGKRMITHSKDSFAKFMSLESAVDSFMLTVQS